MRDRTSSRVFVLSVVFAAVSAATTGCNQLPVDPTQVDPGGGGTPSGPGPSPTPTSTASPTPTSAPSPAPSSSPAPSGGAYSCVSSDADRQCIGLKLVSYEDSAGKSSVPRAAAETLVEKMNAIWGTCNIAFQLEDYETVDPTVTGLTYGAGSQNELTDIRKEFGNKSTFLVVVTGPWSGKTIAWTTMPGGNPLGTIVDKDYGQNPMTVGHELGHYMGLYHISNSSNLMNPYIGSNTSGLSSSQCSIARDTNTQYWKNMLRH
jgi:hypothetical protein